MSETTTEHHRTSATTAGADLTVVPRRHPGRWVAAIVVAILAAALISSFARNPNADWPTVRQYLFAEVTLRGLWTTIYLTVAAMVIGVVGGVVIAMMRLSTNPVLSGIASVFVWIFRGTPVLVQIIFWGFLGAFYPTLSIGIPFTDVTFAEGTTSDLIPATVAALLALGLNEIAYGSEIIRAGILSVDHGQTEAAKSLGMNPSMTMRKTVLPQAMRVIIPPMGNETITMLKTTALVSVIAGHDLLSNLQAVYAQNLKVIPLLIVASIWYLILTSVLSLPQRWLERRFGRGVTRTPARPASRLLRQRKDR